MYLLNFYLFQFVKYLVILNIHLQYYFYVLLVQDILLICYIQILYINDNIHLVLFCLLYLFFVLFVIIFWFDMLSHILSNPIPRKWLWFMVVLLLLFPGALVYYFAVKRPFTKAQLAAIPRSERSFF